MRWLKSFVTSVSILFLFHIYCADLCAYQVSKTAGGLDIKWAASQASYYINSTGGPSGNASALQASMVTWTDVATSSFDFLYSGTTTNTSCGVNDGENIVCFGPMGLTGTLAENTFWYEISSGNILDSDIKFNTAYIWATNGSAGAYDIQNVGTHEFGHSLSLMDLYNAADSEKTMFGYSSTGETKKRTLAQDDINGIAYLYPADTTPPTGTIAVNAGASYSTSLSVTLTLSCTDTGGSCAQMQFSNDNATWSPPEAFSTAKAWDLALGEGMKTVYVRYRDTAENWSGTYSDTIHLDTIVPATTASPSGGTYSSSQNIILACHDSAGSGCGNIYYTTNGLDPTTASPVYSTPVNISANTILKFFAVDLAGNQETFGTETYVIETDLLTITTSFLPAGTVDDFYSHTLTAENGALPYSWAISSGTLPDGLTLNSATGEIAGTPSTTGPVAFIVRVTDANSSTAVKNLSITIQSYPVKVGASYYSYLQEAYDASSNGDTIQIQGLEFFGDLFCDQNVSILLQGGYDPDFIGNPSYTTINGTVTISDGNVEVENLIIR